MGRKPPDCEIGEWGGRRIGAVGAGDGRLRADEGGLRGR